MEGGLLGWERFGVGAIQSCDLGYVEFELSLRPFSRICVSRKSSISWRVPQLPFATCVTPDPFLGGN